MASKFGRNISFYFQPAHPGETVYFLLGFFHQSVHFWETLNNTGGKMIIFQCSEVQWKQTSNCYVLVWPQSIQRREISTMVWVSCRNGGIWWFLAIQNKETFQGHHNTGCWFAVVGRDRQLRGVWSVLSSWPYLLDGDQGNIFMRHKVVQSVSTTGSWFLLPVTTVHPVSDVVVCDCSHLPTVHPVADGDPPPRGKLLLLWTHRRALQHPRPAPQLWVRIFTYDQQHIRSGVPKPGGGAKFTPQNWCLQKREDTYILRFSEIL